ncbi:DUF3631 domain-containing protein [Auritidibacter ignavus]|uniref:DUF3631 domain-containing protein n=1 Tax=Auritidibacter ignavus TaxID=678932 RepID=UPI00244AE0DD|nr:DUF3631 domain-containing protein [Auritidibacter ignavus]WGH82740.1 DUF3631 domain-containing protein [Auritidibacter ignavus]WHS36119.1 DUF3631 domain-containing protein [Auritidibacter ignavus]
MSNNNNAGLDGYDGSDGLDGYQDRAVPQVRQVTKELREHLATYLYVASNDDLDKLTLWVFHTWLFRETYTTPRLLLTSPVPGSGKTTVLEHLERLTPNAILSTNVSPALIPRLIGDTDRVVLIDEAEKVLSPNKEGRDDILAVINSGYKTGGKRPVLAQKGSNWEPLELSTFAPLAMAGNNPLLPDDTMQRTLKVVMYRADEGDVRESHWELLDEPTRALGTRLAQVADLIREQVKKNIPPVPKGCTGRIKERWLPLKRIAVYAGEEWTNKVDEMIIKDLQDMENDKEAGISYVPIQVHLVQDIHEVFEKRKSPFIPTTELLDQLVTRHPERWGEQLVSGRKLTVQKIGRILSRDFSIRSGKHSPIPGDETRGYLRDHFVKAWKTVGLKVRPDSSSPSPLGKPSKPSKPSEPSRITPPEPTSTGHRYGPLEEEETDYSQVALFSNNDGQSPKGQSEE